jgi:hypothetical protein
VSFARLVCLLLLALAVGCTKPYSVGDQVLVEWEGKEYPAKIISVEGPTKFRVHFDGYDNIWDETVSKERLKGFAVEGRIVHPEPPPKVRAKAVSATQTNIYRIGDRVRVEWHGQLYPAVVTAIVGQERYRIHYEGYGPEWDEQVGVSRIQPK